MSGDGLQKTVLEHDELARAMIRRAASDPQAHTGPTLDEMAAQADDPCLLAALLAVHAAAAGCQG